MGADLGEGWGTDSPKFEVGDGLCIRSPNIWRCSVIGSVAKYEQTKKGVKEEIFYEINVFVKKGVIFLIYQM